jgi:adenosylmethionine-8-amino-7-oxononanoate aminotransferase
MKTAGLPLPVKSAQDSYIELENGRRIIDCISSWWVTLHGHGNEEIAAAIHKQALSLEHVIFAGFTHEPAQQLTAQLLRKLPAHFNRVFFSDNGSTSVEVAVKMAFQYWRNVGKPQRTKFIGFNGGYHGDTLGAMSAGGSSAFWGNFRPLMFDIDTVPYPATFENDAECEAKEAATLRAIEKLLTDNEEQYAAIIIEPLVQGAAGMRMCSPAFLKKLEALVKPSGTLIIYDEVMTGFGRTGEWFSCTKAGTQPDIICLSKGITGGFLPLAVTVCSEEIYQAFYADELEKALFHSHSYTGNPIACAAAVASMNLLSQTEIRFQSMESYHRRLAAKYVQDLPFVSNLRFCGTIVAFDIELTGGSSYFNKAAADLRSRFLAADLLLRPLGSTIYLMPPYCTDTAILETVYAKVRQVLTCYPEN